MSETLKACPFCGGEARFNANMDDNYIECRTCRAQSEWFDTIREAIAAWNTRPTDTDEALEAALEVVRAAERWLDEVTNYSDLNLLALDNAVQDYRTKTDALAKAKEAHP